ncbi:MAG: hypothetical protein LBP63_06810 [Prevotellaceae bacterium]|jgi:peptidoglycan hydrolase CwlO-like protein|nr:hypothetical protein [Prevotellaceae bacterium]
MKTNTKILFIAVLFAALSSTAQAQEKNPVLKNTFTASGGQLIVADIWNEIKISDLSYETVKDIITTVKSLKQNLQNAVNTISKQKQAIEKMQRELYEQKQKLDQMESDIRNLKNKVK